MDDHEIGKLIIVTQTSHASPGGTRKHPGGDRTGNFQSRAKMTADIAETINVGLYFYEQVFISNTLAGVPHVIRVCGCEHVHACHLGSCDMQC